eukprot:maker-scaffold_4-snap-gene-14.5-mRNA-1 protein AED:0.00 eAED:0.00 QI:103/1/1/1/1/1/2/102/267
MKVAARKALNCLDLTSLNESDTAESITELCIKSQTIYGPPAALCVYSQHLQTCVQYFKEKCLPAPKLATVVNFPKGDSSLEIVQDEIKTAFENGADEIDLVLNYKSLLEATEVTLPKVQEELSSFLSICQENITKLSPTAKLKVIIESGELQQKDMKLVEVAASLAIEAGADFVKTSTGKVKLNATLEATEIILNTISKSGKNVGFKAAGGIRSVADAEKYIKLAEKTLGDNYVKPERFRFGASSVLKSILSVLSNKEDTVDKSGNY